MISWASPCWAFSRPFRRRRMLLIFAPIILLTVIIYLALTNESAEDVNFEFVDKSTLERRLVEISEVEARKRSPFLYQKRFETSHVDCGRVLSGDKEYTESLTGIHRIPMVENAQLDMSCSAILRRVNPFPGALRPLKNGVAFARIVYKDYEFLERQVQTTYHPQNYYCFAVDRKSTQEFKGRIEQLVECLPNAVMLPILHEFDSAGHNYNLANTLCMREVLKEPGWNYLFLLQNHDVIMKSIYEIERIYELFGGANDVDIQPEEGRVDLSLPWDPKSLRLFRNETGIDTNLLNSPMKMMKGDSQASMSRAAVDWLVNSVDLTIFIAQWNESRYANDEQFLASFQANAAFGMPGHFTGECGDIRIGSVSRLCQWERKRLCSTRVKRHSICILGIEDLRMVAAYPNLMVNKALPAFDYSIVECTAELLHNRTFLAQNDNPLEESYYLNMVNVLYHKNRKKPGYQLECTPNYTTWNQMAYPY